MGISTSVEVNEALDKLLSTQKIMLKKIQDLSLENKNLSFQVVNLKSKVDSLINTLNERDAALIDLKEENSKLKCKLNKIETITDC